MRYSGVQWKRIHEKILKLKISCQTPIKFLSFNIWVPTWLRNTQGTALYLHCQHELSNQSLTSTYSHSTRMLLVKASRKEIYCREKSRYRPNHSKVIQRWALTRFFADLRFGLVFYPLFSVLLNAINEGLEFSCFTYFVCGFLKQE